MEMLSHLCPDSFGIEVAGFHFSDMDYADDAVLLTSDPRNWSNVLGCYEDSASTVGLHTNWLKTKIQNIGAGSAPEMVSMHGQTVEPVVKFTYLGSDVDSEGYSTPEIHRRLGMGNSIMGQLDAIWRQQKLSLQTKLRLYTSLVLSVHDNTETYYLIRDIDLGVSNLDRWYCRESAKALMGAEKYSFRLVWVKTEAVETEPGSQGR